MTGAPRVLSAGVVVVRRAPGAEPRYLLLRAYRNWDFPKGEVSPGEAPLQAAVREVAEETGLTDLSFPWGEPYHETPPYSRGKVARYYVALSTSTQAVVLPVNPELGRPEHHEFRWLEHAAARELLVERLRAVLDWAASVLESPRSPAADR
jgi:bis(5'-nucleosidyl)-tetraphosphatase